MAAKLELKGLDVLAQARDRLTALDADLSQVEAELLRLEGGTVSKDEFVERLQRFLSDQSFNAGTVLSKFAFLKRRRFDVDTVHPNPLRRGGDGKLDTGFLTRILRDAIVAQAQAELAHSTTQFGPTQADFDKQTAELNAKLTELQTERKALLDELAAAGVSVETTHRELPQKLESPPPLQTKNEKGEPRVVEMSDVPREYPH